MEKENKHIGIKILFSLILIVVCFYLYSRYLNPYSFTVKEIAITSEKLPSNYNGLKIAQFSDLHYGRTTNEATLKKLVTEINKLNADIIIFTGDIYDTKIKDQDLIVKYLNQIHARLFKFACLGDYDLKNKSTIAENLAKSDFILLDNSTKLVYDNSTIPLNFIGLTDTTKINELYDNEYYNITITHEPDNTKKLYNTPIVFAGHSLGGQYRLPFIGGIKKKNGARTYYEAYHQVNDIKLYISNGLGTEDNSLRVFNSPSITLYRLYN